MRRECVEVSSRSAAIPQAIKDAQAAEEQAAIDKAVEAGKKPPVNMGGATPGWNTKPNQGKTGSTHDNSR